MLPRKVALKEGRSVRLRVARRADARATIDLVGAVASERVWYLVDRVTFTLKEEYAWLRKHRGGSEGIMIVAEEPGGRLVGNCSVTREGFPKARHMAHLGIGMRKEYRGVGLGRELMLEAIAWARRAGVRKLTLQVFASNTRAIRLYRVLGFKVDGINRAHYKIRGRYTDNIHMALWLAS